MAPDLIEIEPRELKFTFELKKQSSCTIQLINNTNSYVAFKIKTTSPKRYCVRPNTGVILPKSTCDFTVTMQAQRVAPADMQLRDKFLVQSTIVPYGTTDEDLVPSLFSKETGRQIEESKLRVVLVSPPHSPILQPINGAVKQELTYAAPVLNETPVLKETPLVSDQELTQDENLHPSHDPKDVDDLKQKLSNLEVKLLEAEKTMSKLREEKNAAVQEKEKLQHDIASITNKEVRGSGSSRLSLSVCGFHRACQSGTWISFTSMNENCIGNEVTTLGRDIFLHQRLLQPGKLSKQLFLVLNI